MRLPVIDISSFMSAGRSAEKPETVIALHDACRNFGAFYLTGHGIDTGASMDAIKRFFSIPAADKRAVAVKQGGFLRGYIGMGEESGSAALEVKEAFSYGYPWSSSKPPANSMQGSNVWPVSDALASDWKSQMESFFSSMTEVAKSLVRAFSVSYGYDEQYLSGFCKEGDTISVMRLFHYFPYENADTTFPEQHDRIGSSPHTDWGFLTLILQQDGVTGLQFHHEGQWFDIPPMPGTLLVNCGDYFSLLTGGDYVSPLHRVVSEGVERTSGVLFFYPDFEARIPMLGHQDYSLLRDQRQVPEGGVKTDPAKTPFGEYIRQKWEQVQRTVSRTDSA